MAYRNLTQATIDLLAARYGFEPTDRDVIESANQADETHGKPCPRFDGNMKTFWGCDRSGRYDAARLLDGYLDQISNDARIDGLAAREFEQAAYG